MKQVNLTIETRIFMKILNITVNYRPIWAVLTVDGWQYIGSKMMKGTKLIGILLILNFSYILVPMSVCPFYRGYHVSLRLNFALALEA